jgi:hypothetical protein
MKTETELFENAKAISPGTISWDYEPDMPPHPPETDRTGTTYATRMDRLDRTELDMQITTAHQFPRSIQRFKQEAMSLATLDEETAASCFYKLLRDEKTIEGPGVRLAEIVGSAWGNIRYGARIVGEEGEFIMAQGIAHDLEKNVAATIEIRRRIVNRQGRRYSTDMIGVTANAACSIALRNAIFKVVPRAFVAGIYAAAKQVAIGDASTLVDRRQSALVYFLKLGVSEDRILAVLKKTGGDDIDLGDLELLMGIRTAISDGDTTVDAAFPTRSPKKVYRGSDTAVKPKARRRTKKQPAPKTPPST